jgi:hypothetical protein
MLEAAYNWSVAVAIDFIAHGRRARPPAAEAWWTSTRPSWRAARASVMKRVAAPMVGGMLSSTVLTLLVVPAIYSLGRQRDTTAGPAPLADVDRLVPSRVVAACLNS